MSAFGKGVRCDFCGKISNRADGQYRRPFDAPGRARKITWGTIGRIGEWRFPDGSMVVDERDICEECRPPYEGMETAPK